MDEDKARARAFENDLESKTHVEWDGVAMDSRSGGYVLYINGGSQVLEVHDIAEFRTAIANVLDQDPRNVTRAWRRPRA